MTKLRKQRQQKTFQYSVNRKRVRKNRTQTGRVQCPEVKNLWKDHKSIHKNVDQMGLSSDPNKTIQMPNSKKDRLKIVRIVNGFVEEDFESKPKKGAPFRKNAYVAEQLEEDANALRESGLRLPKGVIEQLSYFLDKYQLNYKAMVRDRKNYDQLTWKQFRAKIKKFMSIPEQFDIYLKTRNLNGENLNWKECDSDDE